MDTAEYERPCSLAQSRSFFFRISFKVVLHALLLVWGESGHRGKERGFVLIVRPYPLTDTSQHAALWESAPTFREGQELIEAVVGLCDAKQEGRN